MTITNEMAAPAAVLDAINNYAVQLGDYFNQRNITYTVTSNVAAGISVTAGSGRPACSPTRRCSSAAQ